MRCFLPQTRRAVLATAVLITLVSLCATQGVRAGKALTVRTVEEEQDLTNFLIVHDNIMGLRYSWSMPSVIEKGEPFDAIVAENTDKGSVPLGPQDTVSLNGQNLPVQMGGKVTFPAIMDRLGNVFEICTIMHGPAGDNGALKPPATTSCHVEVLPVPKDVPIKVSHASDIITPKGYFRVQGQGLNRLTRVALLDSIGAQVPIDRVAGSSLEGIYEGHNGFIFAKGSYRFAGWDSSGKKYEAPNECIRPNMSLDAPEVTHQGDRAAITIVVDQDTTVTLTGGEPRISLDRHIIPVKANTPALVGFVGNIVGFYDVVATTPSQEEVEAAFDAPKVDAHADTFQTVFDSAKNVTSVTAPFHVVDQAGKPLPNADCAGALCYPGGVDYGRCTSDGNGIARFIANLPGHIDDSLISPHLYSVFGHAWSRAKKQGGPTPPDTTAATPTTPGTTPTTSTTPGTTTATTPATPGTTTAATPDKPGTTTAATPDKPGTTTATPPATPGTTTPATPGTTTAATLDKPGTGTGTTELPPTTYKLPPITSKLPPITYSPGDNPPPHRPPDYPPINFTHTTDKTMPWLTYIGWFEPSQGVFQDDEKFADMPTKQLTRTSPTSYIAELNMAVDRPTLLFGLRPDHHNEIMIKGITTYTIKVPVKHKFTLYAPGEPPTVIYEQPYTVKEIPISGPAGPEQTFEVPLTAYFGVPLLSYNPPVFTFKNAGSYKIVDELVQEDGTPTGIAVDVSGEVVKTVGLKVAFIPSLLITPAAGKAMEVINAVKAKSDALADTSAANIPFWYPIPPASFMPVKQFVHDYTEPYPDELKRIDGRYTMWDSEVHEIDKTRQDRIAGMLTRELGAAANLTGVGRIIVVLDDADFDLLGHTGAVAFTQSEKVIFVRSGEAYDTVAHEIIHTTHFLWSDDEMVGLFGFSYHNAQDDHYAYGVKIETNGERQRMDKKRAVMSNANFDEWITQGTYWHLLPIFQKGLDPDMLLVSGWIKRHADSAKGYKYKGILMPIYNMGGVDPLKAGPGGDWAFELRDGKGAVLGRFPFPVVWAPPDLGGERNLMSFIHRIPNMPGTAEVDLLGPGGVQDTIKISAHAPVVKITEPGSSTAPIVNGKVRVAWTGSDEDNDTLLYSVYYSPDGGNNWFQESFEQSGTTFDTPLEGGTDKPVVKVVVTDGSRSSEAVLAFSVK